MFQTNHKIRSSGGFSTGNFRQILKRCIQKTKQIGYKNIKKTKQIKKIYIKIQKKLLINFTYRPFGRRASTWTQHWLTAFNKYDDKFEHFIDFVDEDFRLNNYDQNIWNTFFLCILRNSIYFVIFFIHIFFLL